MTLPRDIQDYLSSRNFEAIEDAWLSHLEAHPSDIEHFVAIGRALEKIGEDDRARVLLEMVDDGLVQNERWPEHLALLRGIGTLLLEPKKLHPAILKTLQHIHGDSPSYGEMLEKVGLKKAIDDIPKTWKKVDRLETLLDLDIGTIVLLEGKGAGEVVEVNMQLDSFNIKLDDGGSIRVGFGGAAKLLSALPEGHILHRKRTAPEKLEKLRDEQPAELLRIVLESFDGPMTGGDVKKQLVGVVDAKQWAKWWAAARKHPHVLASSKGRHSYTWAATTSDAQDAVWESFETADTRAKLALLRQSTDRATEIRKRMSNTLAALAAKQREAEPGLACEIWFGLEKWGEIEAGSTWEPEWSPHAVIGRAPAGTDLRSCMAGIHDRNFRMRAYELARATRDNWQELFVQLIIGQEADARALDHLANELLSESSDAFGSFFDQLVSQPHKHPAGFTWLVERASNEPFWLQRNPIRLLRQLLRAMNDDTFGPYRAARLEPMLDSGGTLPRLLDHLSEEQAIQAAEALERAPGLADYQRKPLLNALYLRFPQLRQQEEEPLYALPESIEAKNEELRRLAQEEIPANRRAIEAARELGDLRENFEYKSARQRHEYLSARASQLDADLKRARPIDPSTVTGAEIVIGSKVRFEAPNGIERTITVLGPWESKPEDDVLSNRSELVQSFLGTKLGGEVKIGDETFKVASIKPYR